MLRWQRPHSALQPFSPARWPRRPRSRPALPKADAAEEDLRSPVSPQAPIQLPNTCARTYPECSRQTSRWQRPSRRCASKCPFPADGEICALQEHGDADQQQQNHEQTGHVVLPGRPGRCRPSPGSKLARAAAPGDRLERLIGQIVAERAADQAAAVSAERADGGRQRCGCRARPCCTASGSWPRRRWSQHQTRDGRDPRRDSKAT